jgi:hypothetical protein
MAILLHPLFMAAATLCLIAGISAAMLFRKNKNWLKSHKILNSSSLILLCGGVILAATYIATTGGYHLTGRHQISGLIAFILACISLFVGFRQFKVKNKVAMRTAHRWLGRLTFLLITAALILGLILTGIIST